MRKGQHGGKPLTILYITNEKIEVSSDNSEQGDCDKLLRNQLLINWLLPYPSLFIPPSTMGKSL